MNLLVSFIGFIFGLLVFKYPLIVCLLFLIIFIRIKNQKPAKPLIIGVMFGFLRMLMARGIQQLDANLTVGLVIKSQDHYIIVQTLAGRVYLAHDYSFVVGDLIRFQGQKIILKFSSLEGDFSFGNYLMSLGVYRSYTLMTSQVLVKSPLRILNPLIKFLVRPYPHHLNALQSSLLIREYDTSDFLVGKLQQIDMLYVIFVSGIHLRTLQRFVKRIFSVFINDRTSEIFSYLFLIPLFILNITRFVFYRIFILRLAKYMNSKYLASYFTSLEIYSLVGMFFLIFNPYLIFQPAFYLAFALSVLLHLFMVEKGIIGKLKSIGIVYTVLVTYLLFTRQSINVLQLVYPIILTPFISVWYFVYFITLPFSFLENIGLNVLNFVYHLINYLTRFSYIVYFPKINAFGQMMIIILLISLLLSMNARIKPLIYQKLGLILSLCLLSFIPFKTITGFEVIFINVGQGDSILIRGSGVNILVDTGGLVYRDIAREVLIPFFYKERIYTLDYVIITHDDFDHSGALESLIHHFNVKEVVNNKDDFPLSFSKMTLYNLNHKDYYDANLNSLIVYVVMPKLNVLLMADAGTVNEKEILINYPDLKVDAIKIGHHGSNTSTSRDFICHYKPETAIISVGANNFYGHPHPDVLSTLLTCQVKVLRTDIEGTIRLKSGII